MAICLYLVDLHCSALVEAMLAVRLVHGQCACVVFFTTAATVANYNNKNNNNKNNFYYCYLFLSQGRTVRLFSQRSMGLTFLLKPFNHK